MKNYYQTLGVNRDATPDEIKRAYRKLASQHHPDKGGDNSKFQELEEAYRILSDPRQREMHDNPGFGGMGGFRPDAPFDFDSIFNMFGARFNQGQQHRKPQIRMSLWVTLRDVADGGRRTVSIGTQQGTQAVEIEIPAGINDGDAVQYPNIGPGGSDLIVQYRIHPDPKWTRQELNVFTDHTVDIWDLILGSDTTVRDILGNELVLTITAKTQPGTTLRLRGRGLRHRSGAQGDLLVKLQARIPDTLSPEILAAIEQERTL